MRRALDPRPGTREQSAPVSLPAPVGGWNTRDGRANMPIEDAIAMDNFYPEATDVRPRNGTETYASQIGAQVETIFSYSNGPNLKMFVAAGNVFMNVSTVGVSGTVSGATVTAGTVSFQNSRFQYRNFGTPGGNFLVAVNGVDERQIYNGTIWFAGSVSATATIGSLSNVEVYQRRLFYTENNTLRFVYHKNTDAIGGSVGVFDLSSEMDMGGYLMAAATWTRDGGSGMDDLIAFISNYGQVAVYQGTDPGDATAWSRLGLFKIPSPLSYRCTQKFGGELVIATESGVVPMSGVVSGLVQQTPYTDKIRTSVNDAVATYRSHFGWQLKYVPYLNWLILNVPVSEGDFQQQFVMNSQTNAWCRFKALDANVWELHNNTLYFGGNGTVGKVSLSLNSDSGNDIAVDVRQAASSFGLSGRNKLFRMFRPLVNADGTLTLAADINVDFADVIPTNIPSATPIVVAEWDVATWDNYYWADDAIPALFWQSCGRLGTYGSIRMTGSINSLQVRWFGTDVIFEPGSIGP